jgi:hypothetical protein
MKFTVSPEKDIIKEKFNTTSICIKKYQSKMNLEVDTVSLKDTNIRYMGKIVKDLQLEIL